MWNVGEKKKAYRFLVGKSEGEAPLADKGLDGRIILKLILIERGLQRMELIDQVQNKGSGRFFGTQY